MNKIRIDRLLVDKGLAPSRERAQSFLLAGRVFVNHQRVDKPGTLVKEDAIVELQQNDHEYVSRGGLKLAGVLAPLQINPQNTICADIGASTGGFTDVLLQHGAQRVYAVDVGKGLLHYRLRSDPRVILHEGINARYPLEDLIKEPIDLVVIDVSFISLTLVLPAVKTILAPHQQATICAMVKPQFELTPKEVGRGGVVRDDNLRTKAVTKILEFATSIDLQPIAQHDSPIDGPAGNREIFVKLIHKHQT